MLSGPPPVDTMSPFSDATPEDVKPDPSTIVPFTFKWEIDIIDLSDSEDDVKPQLRPITAVAPKSEIDIIDLSDSEEDVKQQHGSNYFDLLEAAHLQELGEMAKDQHLKMEHSLSM